MIVVFFRSSLFGSWDLCQQKTYISYCLGINEGEGYAALMGTIYHKVFEILALCKLREQNNSQESILDDAVGEIPISFDYNLLEDIDILIQKSYDYYSKKLPDKFSAKKDIKILKKWYDDVTQHFNGLYDPRKRKIFAAEQHFDIELTEPWAKYSYEFQGKKIDTNLSIKGTVDLILEVDKDTIEVVDWKTGQRKNHATDKVKEYHDLCKDTQLMFYYYALKKLYPNKNVLFTIYFVKDGGPFTLCFEEEDIYKIEQLLQERSQEMWDTAKPKLLSYNQTHFKCTKWCGYYKRNWPGTDENICKYVRDHINKNGIQNTTDLLISENFTIGKYHSPGS